MLKWIDFSVYIDAFNFIVTDFFMLFVNVADTQFSSGKSTVYLCNPFFSKLFCQKFRTDFQISFSPVIPNICVRTVRISQLAAPVR